MILNFVQLYAILMQLYYQFRTMGAKLGCAGTKKGLGTGGFPVLSFLGHKEHFGVLSRTQKRLTFSRN
jgi:hypothetical protein